MTPHDHPAVRKAALDLISPSGDLRDRALLLHWVGTEWHFKLLVENAAKVRAGLDALDAAIAQAQAGEAA